MRAFFLVAVHVCVGLQTRLIAGMATISGTVVAVFLSMFGFMKRLTKPVKAYLNEV